MGRGWRQNDDSLLLGERPDAVEPAGAKLPAPLGWKVRLSILAVLGVWAAGLLGQRLYQIQVVEGAVWRHRDRLVTTLVQPIPAPRGRIVDALGRIIVTNEPHYGVAVVPSRLPNLELAANKLADIVHGDPNALLDSLTDKQSSVEPLWVGRSLTAGQVAQVAALQEQMPGVLLEIHPVRTYPYKTLASHVIGYVGDISAESYRTLKKKGYRANDMLGQSGLEASYEHDLRGTAGTQQALVDPLGRTLHLARRTPPTPGPDLRLSLDMALQEHTEGVLQKTLDTLEAQNGEKTAGAVVMLEANTGRVLTLVSRPNFDPRQFARGITAAEYRHLMTDPLHPLLSRVYQASYPPGSTFKLINASASLQSGLCTPQTVFYCTGLYRGFHCFARAGHGAIGFIETIAQSCDFTYYELGDRLGIKRLARFASAFGLGRRTGIDLVDEQEGLLATPAWKKRVFKEEWLNDDTIDMSIGQGMLNATPLQMAVAAAAVANGGYVYAPHLVDKVVSWDHKVLWRYHPRPLRRVPVKKEYLAAVKQGMVAVVDHGTAAGARSSIITMGGKTGTAEATPTVDNPKGRNHTWFVCFAPADHPQVVVAVLVVKAGGYGGGVAAPIAKDVIEYWWTHSDRRHPAGRMGPRLRRSNTILERPE